MQLVAHAWAEETVEARPRAHTARGAGTCGLYHLRVQLEPRSALRGSRMGDTRRGRAEEGRGSRLRASGQMDRPDRLKEMQMGPGRSHDWIFWHKRLSFAGVQCSAVGWGGL